MRPLLFVLLIALLLLRGWTGDAMANDMALASLQHPHQAQQSTPEIIATHTHGESAGAHFDHENAPPAAHGCDGHAAEHAVTADSGHCQSCNACQACNSAALTQPATGANPVFNPGTPPRAGVARFASAEAALGQKPPIS